MNSINMGSSNPIRKINILPVDGDVIYYGKILNEIHANQLFEYLVSNIEWQHDEAIIFGRNIITKRKVAWYGDSNFSYSYSNTTKHALPWTKELHELKLAIETTTNTTFNSCLLNLYHNGQEGMSWHSDDEKSLGKNSTIASVTFGSERKFSFKHKKTKHTVSIVLENGSLLVMKGTTQTFWLHSLPKTKKITTPRINLTFRTIVHEFE